jgi:hypothetical protein
MAQTQRNFLLFAGVALLHGLVAQQRLGRFWLVGLYV